MNKVLKELIRARDEVISILERDTENPAFTPEDRAFDEGYLGALTYAIGVIGKEQQ